MSVDRDRIQIKYNDHHKSFHGEFNSVEFENDGYTILYIPSLRLSAYGKSFEEADAMMRDVVVQDFCETLMEQKLSKILSDLKALGFNQSPFFKTELSKSAHIDKEGLLKDFDLSEDTKFSERVLTV